MPTHKEPRQAVFTALLGGYETLNDAQASSDIPYICFTDDPGLKSDVWTIIQVTPDFPADLSRSQRVIKITGHSELDDYDETLYIDNSVSLRKDPAKLLASWLDGSDITLITHSFRERVGNEMYEAVITGLDSSERVHEQADHYSIYDPEVFEQRPFWGAMIARRNTTEVRNASRIWLQHVLRYSRRDQLSFNASMRQAGVEPRRLELDNYESEWHEWPIESNRKKEMRAGRQALRMPDPLAVGAAERAAFYENLYLQDVIKQYDNSTSWKVTKPLRALMGLLTR